MRFLKELKKGNSIQDIYLVKEKNSAVTKNGKHYLNVTLQDRTGTMECKVWEPESEAVQDFNVLDYIRVTGRVDTFNGKKQATLNMVQKVNPAECIASDYFPVSQKDRKVMFGELTALADTVKNEYLKKLLDSFLREDKEFVKKFLSHSAAKAIHHGFVGGFLEHTLSVAKIADFLASSYPALNRDLLLTAAILHDVGKVHELSAFPLNDYTDGGQLLGHIMIGAEMVHDHASRIEGFPAYLETQLKHCIIAHHGEYEQGSPKKPAIIEAMALNLADNMDAKMEMLTELLSEGKEDPWLGYNRVLGTNIRKTEVL